MIGIFSSTDFNNILLPFVPAPIGADLNRFNRKNIRIREIGKFQRLSSLNQNMPSRTHSLFFLRLSCQSIVT